MATSPSAPSSDLAPEIEARPRQIPIWPWAAGALVLIAAGVVWRWIALGHLSHFDAYAFRHLAYSDIIEFYLKRHLTAHHLPYLQQNVEYPVLTGFFIWLTAYVPGLQGYFLANALVLSACLLASLLLLARMAPAGSLWRFALAPALALYAVLNWDAFGLLFLVAGLYFFRRRRFGWAGVSLALGASAKLFPLFVLPVLLAYAAREGDGETELGARSLRPAFQLLASFLATALIVNLPIALRDWRGWWYFVAFQAGRTINPDSIWGHLPQVPAAVSSHLLADVFVLGVAWLTWRVWRGAPWEPAALLSLLLFLLATRDYSPQYALWVLPFLVLLASPLWLWLVFAAADLFYYAAIFLYWYVKDSYGSIPHIDNVLGGTVWSRELALALLFAWGLSRLNGLTLPAWWATWTAPPAALARSGMRVPALRRLSLPWRQALILLLALRVGLGLVAWASVHLEPVTIIQGAFTGMLIHGGEPWSELISTWQRWDAFFYQQIAEHGYHAGNGTAAFYPLYPLVSRIVSALLVGHIVPAELLVSSASFAVSMWLLYRLARLDARPRVARLAVLLTAFFPTGFFLLAPYTESLFLMLTLASFWFARNGRPWLAGLAGLGAGLTRMQGAFLVLPLAFIYLRKRDEEGKGMGWGLLSATLPPLGLIAFTAYVHRVVHETRSSLGVQALWGYRIVTPWHAIAASWSYINHPFIPGQAPIELLNLGCLLGFALLAVLALWRLPLGYALYAWPYLGLLFMREMGYTPLMSVARFTLVLFPCFIVLAMFLARRPWLANTWLISSILLQALLLSCYVHFEFVG